MTALFKEHGPTSAISPGRPKDYLTGFDLVSICIRVISFSSIETQKKEPLHKRIDEIRQGLEEAGQWKVMPAVCVIPVRMTEAWLLMDEGAVRRAAGNPHGQEALDLPSVGTLEHVSDPKSVLYACLQRASGLSGNRRKRFRVTESAQRISSFIRDFTPLRSLSAFTCLENSIERVVSEQNWAPDLPDATGQE